MMQQTSFFAIRARGFGPSACLRWWPPIAIPGVTAEPCFGNLAKSGSNQVANVGNYPVVTDFHEPIIVEIISILTKHSTLKRNLALHYLLGMTKRSTPLFPAIRMENQSEDRNRRRIP